MRSAKVARTKWMPKEGPCSFEGCGKPLHRVGLCRGHYEQQIKGVALVPLFTSWGLAGASRAEENLPRVDVPDEPPCPRDGLRGVHVCMGPVWAYARSGEAAGG